MALAESLLRPMLRNPKKMDRLPSRAIIIRKQDLAIKLQTIPPHPDPRIALEQYTIPSDLAAEILFRACYVHNDIEQKTVVDLGTGTGRLVLGAAMLGAGHAVGIDLDPDALNVAANYARRARIRVGLVLGDIQLLRGPVETAVMNPPFGTQRVHADMYFLEVALMTARVVYSIHKSSTRNFVLRWLNQRHRRADTLVSTKMEIPHQFSFHHRKRQYVDVDVYRIVHS
jgi:putative methylase